MRETITRRKFVESSSAAALGAASVLSAASYSRVLGANDRINIGFLGCGGRSGGHRRMVEMSAKEKNLAVTAVCDLWKNNREKAAADCRKKFGADVRQFKYSEEMLEMKDLDGIMIATGDHQHAKILAEVVKAGKDCYCEKPLSIDVADAKLARDAVRKSTQVVQMGSQWLSDPIQIKVRDIVRSGRLGQITKISQCWNDNNHRWHEPDDPDIKALREEDTDWNRWLLERKYRPFDPTVYFEFRIFKDYSGGITSQWMSHGIGLVHFYTDTAIPDTMAASGGIFGWPDVRENPDYLPGLGYLRKRKIPLLLFFQLCQ